MMLPLAIALAVQAAEVPAPESCAPPAHRFIESSKAIWQSLGRMAGLSASGQATVTRMHQENALTIWCGEQRPASDLARERLLSVLAEEKINQVALAEARRVELEAIMRSEEAEMDRLLRTFAELSPDDRRKLAAWLLNDAKRTWAKRERAQFAK